MANEANRMQLIRTVLKITGSVVLATLWFVTMLMIMHLFLISLLHMNPLMMSVAILAWWGLTDSTRALVNWVWKKPQPQGD